MHDSRTGDLIGVLAQDGGEDPTNTLRRFVSEVTGIDLRMVQPLWLDKPMQRPSIGTNWCALGLTETVTHGTPFSSGRKGNIESAESGDVTQVVHQTSNIRCSIYGPKAASLADALLCSMRLSQNAGWLAKQGIQVQEIDAACTRVPDLLHDQWVNRYDFSFRIGTRVRRVFGVRTIAALGAVDLITEKE